MEVVARRPPPSSQIARMPETLDPHISPDRSFKHSPLAAPLAEYHKHSRTAFECAPTPRACRSRCPPPPLPTWHKKRGLILYGGNPGCVPKARHSGVLGSKFLVRSLIYFLMDLRRTSKSSSRSSSRPLFCSVRGLAVVYSTSSALITLRFRRRETTSRKDLRRSAEQELLFLDPCCRCFFCYHRCCFRWCKCWCSTWYLSIRSKPARENKERRLLSDGLF